MLTRFKFIFFILLTRFYTYGQINTSSHRVNMSVNPSTGFLEINNGLLGIVIPWKQAESKKTFNYAPIQSIIYKEGQYSDNTPNYLTSPSEPISFKTSVLIQTDIEVKVLLDYRFMKMRFEFDKGVYPGSEPGPGYYRCTLSIKKDDKAIIAVEESNYDVYYLFKISQGLNPDQARYRGWNATELQWGREPDGKIYRSESERGYPMDATVDLKYSEEFYYPKISLWDQAGGEQNTGRYWQVYNSKASNGNLIGFFQGKPSLLIGARLSGPQLKVQPQDPINKEHNCAEILVSINRRTADNMWFPKKRFSWGIYISRTTELNSPEKDQAIAKAMNFHSGFGDSIRIFGEKIPLLHSTFFQGAIYMPETEISALIQKVKTDQAFYNSLIQIDGVYRSIWDAWRFKDSVQPIINRFLSMKTNLIRIYETGNGIYDWDTRYWLGVRNFKITALTISCLFADKTNRIDSKTKNELLKLIGIMAKILWDNDNVPVLDSAGVNLGPANMIFQYRNNGRYFFALLLSKDPEYSKYASQIIRSINQEIESIIYPNGSTFGSPHYLQPAIDPVFFTLLQIRQTGLGDYFINPRIEKFAAFITSLLTPPSCRFNGNRKLISFGDGSEESAGTFGLLATGLKPKLPRLSEVLMSIYFNGPPGYIFAGPAPLAIPMKPILANSKLSMTSCSYDGYMSHFRSAINSTKETALWVLNGEKFYDHRNDDRGELALYALGAPLSLSRSCFYSPHAPGSKIRSLVVPYSKFPEWASTNQPIAGNSLTDGASWTNSKLIEFASFEQSSYTHIKMHNPIHGTWDRKIYQVMLSDSTPIFVCTDSTTSPSIWSMNMMATGPIKTPQGYLEPNLKIHNNQDKKELPEGTPEQATAAGWNTYEFKGQVWKQHYSNGINWSLMTYNPQSTAFSLAHWGTTWQNTHETNDFYLANQKPYQEDQQILRIKFNNVLVSVIIPQLKSAPHQAYTVTTLNNVLLFNNNQDTIHIFNDAYRFKNKIRECITYFGPAKRMTIGNHILNGSCISIDFKQKNITCNVHGASGIRFIQFPYKVSQPVYQKDVYIKSDRVGSVVTINYISPGLDLANGAKGFTTYNFKKA